MSNNLAIMKGVGRMPDFVYSEESIRSFFSVGVQFVYDGQKYTVEFSGKPKKSKGIGGEPKTDIYVLACDENGEKREFKISYKQENADFLENKMSAERAEQIFGCDWENRIMAYTESVKDLFERKCLIYKESGHHTKKGAFTLGWRFEFVDKSGGELSGDAKLSFEEKIEVYSGRMLVDRLKNAKVNGKIIPESGIADYVVKKEEFTSAQDIINSMKPVEQYIKEHPDVFFVCKALNYRSMSRKYDGDRPLAVQVKWTVVDGKLHSELRFDRPLKNNGKAQRNSLLQCCKQLSIQTTDDINASNSDLTKVYE